MSTFELHPQLAQDTHLVGDLTLCRVLLMDDANFPWVILVPRRAGVSEIFELSEADQQRLLRESGQLASNMLEIFKAEKMNIAALGNVVPQLHLHHIARHSHDQAWPKPVWGQVPRQAYAPGEAKKVIDKLAFSLGVPYPAIKSV